LYFGFKNAFYGFQKKTFLQIMLLHRLTCNCFWYCFVARSKTLLGTPYIYGACNEDGFDCSGFVYYVFRHFQIEVPRSSRQFKDFGEEVLIDNVQKGDILVFLGPTSTTIGHVGIVSNPKGKESDFIHASSGRSMKVIISSLKQDQYAQRFVKAVRAF
jgi:cell wall-associated NlpC family hydrolase